MVAYQRGKAGTQYVHVPAPGGGSVIRSTGTNDPDVAADIEDALKAIRRKRWPDVLQAIIDQRPGFSLDEVRDAWAEERLSELRAQLADVDVAPQVAKWHAALVLRFANPTNPQPKPTPHHYLTHVRSFIPDGTTCMASTFTAERLTAWLAALERKPATKCRYWAAMNSFTKYLVAARVLVANPMDTVPFPPEGAKRLRYLALPDILRLVEAADEPFRTLEALAHGAGMEMATFYPTQFLRRDIMLHPTKDEATIHAHGTKTPARDRVVQLDAWAVPYLRRHIAGMLPNAPVFPDLVYGHVNAAHRAACRAIGITDYTLHDARHSYAVRYIAAGVPAEFVARQLGHKNTDEVNDRYGRFRPTVSDAARYQAMAAARDAEVTDAARRDAESGR